MSRSEWKLKSTASSAKDHNSPYGRNNGIDTPAEYRRLNQNNHQEYKYHPQFSKVNRILGILVGEDSSLSRQSQQSKGRRENASATNGNGSGYQSPNVSLSRNGARRTDRAQDSSSDSREPTVSEPSSLGHPDNKSSSESSRSTNSRRTSLPTSTNRCAQCSQGYLIGHAPRVLRENEGLSKQWPCRDCATLNSNANSGSTRNSGTGTVQENPESANSGLRRTSGRPISFSLKRGTAARPITVPDSPRVSSGKMGDTSPVVIDLTEEDVESSSMPQASKTVSHQTAITVAPVAPMAINPGPSTERSQQIVASAPAQPPSTPAVAAATPQQTPNPVDVVEQPLSDASMEIDSSRPPSPEEPAVRSGNSSPPYSPPPAFPEDLSMPPVAVTNVQALDSVSHVISVLSDLNCIFCSKKWHETTDHTFIPRQTSPDQPPSEPLAPPTLFDGQSTPLGAGLARWGPKPSPSLAIPPRPKTWASRSDTTRATKRPSGEAIEPPPIKRAMTAVDLVMQKYSMQPIARTTSAPAPIRSPPAAATTNDTSAVDKSVTSPISRRSLSGQEKLPGNTKQKQLSVAAKPSPPRLATSEWRPGCKLQPASSTTSPLSAVNSQFPGRVGSTPTYIATGKTARKSAPASKEPRSGPAMKRAGRLVYAQPNPTDSEDSVDEFTGLKDENARLKEQLRQQKDYTKRQSELASRQRAKTRVLEREITELKRDKCERENKFNRLLKLSPTDGHVPMRTIIDTIDLAHQAEITLVARRPPLKKEIFADDDFLDSASDEEPSPKPALHYKPREMSWRKTKYSALDKSRLMKVHLHREREPVRPPVRRETNAVMIHYDPEEPATVTDSSTPVTSIIRYRHPAPKTLEEIFGLPEEPIPVLRDGTLCYKSGVINQRSRLPDRNAPCFKVYGPRDLQS